MLWSAFGDPPNVNVLNNSQVSEFVVSLEAWGGVKLMRFIGSICGVKLEERGKVTGIYMKKSYNIVK